MKNACALILHGPPAYVADLNGRISFANARYRALAENGAPAGSVPPDQPIDPVFPINEVAARVIAGEDEIQRRDMLVKAGDNHGRYFRSTHFPIRDEAGALIGIGGLYEDASSEVTNLLDNVAALERFDDIARLVSDWIWETDEYLKLTYVSSRVSEILDILPRELIGCDILSLGRFVDFDGEPATAPPQIAARVPFRNARFLLEDARGRPHHFQISGLPVFSEDGAFRGYRGTATDISGETAARQFATTSQERLKAAIENISEGFALFGKDGRLQLFNGQLSQFLKVVSRVLIPGVPYEGLTEALAENGFADIDATSRAWQSLPRHVREAGADSIEFRMSDNRWLRLNARAIDDGGMVTIFSDITEMKKREKALQQSIQVAEEASRSKSQFLANMSHELRTPLNAIIGFSEIMHNEALGPVGCDRYHEYLTDIIDSSRHLLGIINDILEVAKAEAGQLELNEQTVSVEREIAAAVRLFVEQAAQSKLTLKTEIDPSLPDIRADQRKLRQILLNLISNSTKFTPAGGTITVGARLDSEGAVCVSVADTGIGIPDKDMEAAMAPFGQVDSKLARRFDGTGLGLPLTQALAECHGAKMTIDSRPGAGTTVTVCFPKSRVLG